MSRVNILKELRQKEDKELALDLLGLRKELFDLRFQSTTEKLTNPSRISQIRREVARIKTLLREREIAAAPASAERNPHASKTPATPAHGTSSRS